MSNNKICYYTKQLYHAICFEKTILGKADINILCNMNPRFPHNENRNRVPIDIFCIMGFFVSFRFGSQVELGFLKKKAVQGFQSTRNSESPLSLL